MKKSYKTDPPQYGVGLSDEPILTPARVARSARVAKKYLATLDLGQKCLDRYYSYLKQWFYEGGA